MPILQVVARTEISVHLRFTAAIFIVPILKSERAIRGNVTAIDFLVKHFLLADMLQFLLKEIFLSPPIPMTEKTLRIHRLRNDRQKRHDETVFLEEFPITIGAIRADTMTAEQTGQARIGRCRRVHIRRKDFRELEIGANLS